jgi:flavin-dependent dehydrogenase
MERHAMTPRLSAYDLIIAGGGPAGCAAAITAKRALPSAKILLLEKGTYPRHKVCGEFVSPEALGLLRSLIGDESAIATALRIEKGQLLMENTTLDVPLKPAAISLPRYQLDALLWSAALRAGVECVTGTATQVSRANGEYVVHLERDKLQARAVINASGRWSNLSESPAPKEKWIGLKAHFAEPSPPSTVNLYFFSGGYCGVQPVDGSSVNACAMVQADVARDLASTWKQHPALQARSQSWTQLTETFATAPLVFRPPRATRDGVLLAGDAAGFIDPFLGDGISLALRSGAMAGQAVADFCAGKVIMEGARARYERAYERNLAPAFQRASHLRRLLTLPTIIRTPLINLARLPGVAGLVFRSTRATGS